MLYVNESLVIDAQMLRRAAIYTNLAAHEVCTLKNVSCMYPIKGTVTPTFRRLKG
jgi:hypothetical protein